jgi:hypothetical protein
MGSFLFVIATLSALFVMPFHSLHAQGKEPLRLVQTIPITSTQTPSRQIQFALKVIW